MNELGCPWIGEADSMCNVLVNEVAKAQTWARMRDAIWAIQRVRTEERNHVAEWEHLNNPSPQSCKQPNAKNEGLDAPERNS